MSPTPTPRLNPAVMEPLSAALPRHWDAQPDQAALQQAIAQVLAALGLAFLLLSVWALEPTPPEHGRTGSPALPSRQDPLATAQRSR